MGFHVGSENDSEGDECFDGSVPLQAGDSEPTEPWQEALQRSVPLTLVEMILFYVMRC